MNRLLLALLLFSPLAFGATDFAWRTEGTPLDGTADFSSGDTTATVNGGVSFSATAKKVGTNGILTTDASDFYVFDGTSIGSIDTGTMGVWIQYKTAVPTSGLLLGITLRNSTNANDNISIMSGTSQEFRFGIRQNGVAPVTLDTTAVNAAVDTWYFVKVSWDIPNDDRYIAVYDSSCALIETPKSDLVTDLNTYRPASALDVIRIGNNSSNANVMWFDNAIIADTYDAPVQKWCAATAFNPSFSAAPAAGTITTTTIPVTFTSSQDGTVYGVACTNGQTATHAQVVAGTCSGAAIATFSQAVVADVADGDTFSGLTASTTYDTYYAIVSTLGGPTSASASLADQTTSAAGGSPPSFTSGPSLAAATNGFTVSGTILNSGTVYAVAYSPALTVPTCTQIKAGNDVNNAAALISANEAWTSTVANDFLLTLANQPVRFDVAVCASNGGGDSGVTEFTNQNRSADSGQAIVVTTSISTTSVCDLDTHFNPDVAIGDVIEYTTTSTPGGYTVAFTADCDFTVAAGGSTVQQSFGYSIQDVSSTTTGLFTDPTTGNFTTDENIVTNNHAPVCDASDQGPLVWTTNSAILDVDLNSYCSDADGDTLSYPSTGDNLPNGIGWSGSIISGTPDTENETGVNLSYSACDLANECTSVTLPTAYVVTTWTLPNLVGTNLGEAASAIIVVAPWRESDPGVSVSSFACDPGVATGDIISQSPAASSELGAFDAVTVVLDRECPSTGKVKKSIGIHTGL